MKLSHIMVAASAATSLLVGTSAHAAYAIVQTAAQAPTYSTVLDLNAAGSPTGTVSSTFWTATLGVTVHTGQGGSTVTVNDFSGTYPWVNSGNQFLGNFGLNLDFATPISSLSFQAWDSNGAPGPIGGGFFVSLTTGALGGGTQLAGQGFTGAWGGLGNTWYNITTTGGSTFQHVTIFNNGFDQFDYISHVSWQTAPAPGALTLLGFAGVVGVRRRRRA
jgi:MYXO-CTERM domain-containing protein